MQSENLILDQLAKLMTSAAGAAKGVRDEIGTLIKTQAERLVNDLDLVPREEFEAMKAMALKARKEVELLSARLGKLETANAKNDSRDSHLFKTPRNKPIRRTSPVRAYRR
jgi:BMFP domain-containing protein YqiC